MRSSPCLRTATHDPLTYQRVGAPSPKEHRWQGCCTTRSARHRCVYNMSATLWSTFLILVAFPPVTTLRQRLLQPDFQPSGASQLHPKHKHLLMKRSLRCRVRLGLFVFWMVLFTCVLCARDSADTRLSFPRNASIIWANRNSTRLRLSSKFSWWLCEY